MAFLLSDDFKKRAEKLISIYPEREAVILPLLHEIQREHGYISGEAIDAISEYLKVPRVRLHGILTFYTMFNRKPRGRFHLQVCRNLSCSMMGAESILDFLKKRLAIGEGETTADGFFTLSTVECLGSCGTAPVIMVNDEYHEGLTVEAVEELIKELRNGRKDPAQKHR